jgi:hypothetical protein
LELCSGGKARLKEKATGDALRLFGQAIAEADKIKEDQDRLQAKLMLVQLFMDVNSSSGFERAAEAFKAINHFSDFNMNRSYFAVKVTVYGMMSEEPVIPPAQSSLVSTVAKMCRLNCEETFQVSGLLEKKELRLWATFVAVQTGLRESSKEARQ